MLSKNSLALACALTIAVPVALAMGGNPAPDDDAVAARIQPVAHVELAGAATKTAGGNRSGAEMVKTICGVCHGVGAAG